MEHGARVVRRHECQGGPRHACIARRLARSRARRAWRRRTAPREVRRLRRARGAWGPNPCAARRRGVPLFSLSFAVLFAWALYGVWLSPLRLRSRSVSVVWSSVASASAPVSRPCFPGPVLRLGSASGSLRSWAFGLAPVLFGGFAGLAPSACSGLPRPSAAAFVARRPAAAAVSVFGLAFLLSLALRSRCVVVGRSGPRSPALPRALPPRPRAPSARFPRPGLAPVRSRSLWGPLAVSLGVAAVARAAAAVAVASGRLPSCSAPPPPPGPRPPLFVRGRFRSLSRSASPPSLGPPPPLSGRRFRSLAVRLGVVAVARAAVAVCRRFLFLRASARRAPPVRGTSRAAAACAPVRRRARGAPAVLPRVRPCCTAYVKRPRDHDVCACAAPSRSDAPAPRVRLCSTA